MTAWILAILCVLLAGMAIRAIYQLGKRVRQLEAMEQQAARLYAILVDEPGIRAKTLKKLDELRRKYRAKTLAGDSDTAAVAVAVREHFMQSGADALRRGFGTPKADNRKPAPAAGADPAQARDGQ